MQNDLYPNPQQQDELSFKEIITRLSVMIAFLWGYKFRLGLICLVFAAIGFTYAHFKRSITYTSHLSFAVEEKSGGGAFSGLASQFGLDVGGGGAGLFSADNLMLLLRSKRIIEQALLTPMEELNGDMLVNVYLRDNKKEQLESGKIELFDKAKKREKYTRKEDSILNLVGTSVQKSILINKIDKKASLLHLQLSSGNEYWAFLMSQLLIDQATDLYLDLKVGKTRRTVAILESRVDSVKRELDAVMGSAAMESDQNQGVIMMRARVPAAKKQIQIQILTTMYGELLKNLELTRFTLDREEPVIEIIDAPAMPLPIKGKGRITLAVFCAFFAFVFSSGYLLIKRHLTN